MRMSSRRSGRASRAKGLNVALHCPRKMSVARKVATWAICATIPLAIWLQFSHGDLVWLFIASCAAVLPLAAWIGVSTEHLAHRMGPTYGALFNATFGNFAELVIAIFAIRAGLPGVVLASF